MKKYTMLKTVQGSRDGIKVETFAKGEKYDLQPELAEQFYNQGVIEEAAGNPADSRQKKVTGPKEIKQGEAGDDLDTQTIEELVALARDTYGLDVDSTMSVEEVKALIEEAAGKEDSEGDISQMTKKQLVAHAQELGLELDEKLNKAEMLDAIKAHTAA